MSHRPQYPLCISATPLIAHAAAELASSQLCRACAPLPTAMRLKGITLNSSLVCHISTESDGDTLDDS